MKVWQLRQVLANKNVQDNDDINVVFHAAHNLEIPVAKQDDTESPDVAKEDLKQAKNEPPGCVKDNSAPGLPDLLCPHVMAMLYPYERWKTYIEKRLDSLEQRNSSQSYQRSKFTYKVTCQDCGKASDSMEVCDADEAAKKLSVRGWRTKQPFLCPKCVWKERINRVRIEMSQVKTKVDSERAEDEAFMAKVDGVVGEKPGRPSYGLVDDYLRELGEKEGAKLSECCTHNIDAFFDWLCKKAPLIAYFRSDLDDKTKAEILQTGLRAFPECNKPEEQERYQPHGTGELNVITRPDGLPQWHIECFCCVKTFDVHFNGNDASPYFEAMNWRKVNNRWFCPQCAKELKEMS